MDEDDPDFQKWKTEHNAKKKKKFLDDLKKRVKKGEITVEQIIEAKKKNDAAKLEKQKAQELKRQKLREIAIQRYGPKFVEVEERWPEYKKKRLAEMRYGKK